MGDEKQKPVVPPPAEKPEERIDESWKIDKGSRLQRPEPWPDPPPPPPGRNKDE